MKGERAETGREREELDKKQNYNLDLDDFFELDKE